MATDLLLVDAALRAWEITIARSTKLFDGLDMEREIAPGKNRVIYLYGHLIALHDAMFATLRLGERKYAELDAVFVKAADKSVAMPPVGEMKAAWSAVHERLDSAMRKLTPAEWVERHASVSEEDFVKEPHRNRMALLLSRTSHVAYHVGQVVLAK